MAGCWAAGAIRRHCLGSGEGPNALGREFGRLEKNLVQSSFYCGGRGGSGVVQRSRPKRGSRWLADCLGSVWEESEWSSTGCGGRWKSWKFLGKLGLKVFVVVYGECGWSHGMMLGGLRLCLFGE